MKHFLNIFLIIVFFIIACLAFENKFIFGFFVVICPIITCMVAFRKARKFNKLDFKMVNKEFTEYKFKNLEKENISEIKEDNEEKNSATDLMENKEQKRAD